MLNEGQPDFKRPLVSGERVMRGILIQRQYPHICDNNALLSEKRDLLANELKNGQFKMNTAYCDTTRLKFNLPQTVFTLKGAYDLSDVSNWKIRLGDLKRVGNKTK